MSTALGSRARDVDQPPAGRREPIQVSGCGRDRGCPMPSCVSGSVRCGALLASMLAALVCVAAPAATRCPGARTAPLPEVAAADVRTLACVVTRERARRGRRALVRGGALDRAAAGHALDMVRRQYFDHRSPGGSTPADRARSAGYLDGVRSWRVGEVLAWGTGVLATPASIVAMWLHSAPHRALLLDRSFSDFGLGIATGSPRPGVTGAATYTMLLGTVSR